MAGSVKTPLSLQGPQTGQRSPVLPSQCRPVLPLGPGLTLPTVPADRRRGRAWPVLLAPALLSGRRPQASDPDPGGDTRPGGPAFRRAAKFPLCGHHCKSSQAPCWQCRRNHGDRLGRQPESAQLSPAGTEGPGGHTAPNPGWRGQRGRGPPGVKQAGCAAPHPGRGGDGQGAQSPTLSGTGGAGRGHSPARWLPSALAPLGCTCG